MLLKLRRIILYLVCFTAFSLCLLTLKLNYIMIKSSLQVDKQSGILTDMEVIHKDVHKKRLSKNFRKYPDFSTLKTFLFFIGYHRSGSTLIGSLLDAHPYIVVAHEYNLLVKWHSFTDHQKNADFVYNQLWENSVNESRTKRRSNSTAYLFQYQVPGLYQGGYRDNLLVIGDKKCKATTQTLARNPDRFREVSEVLGLQSRFIHLIRNPFDNIATMVLRETAGMRQQATIDGFDKFEDMYQMRKQSAVYLRLVDMNVELHRRFKGKVLDVYYTSLVTHPRKTLRRICLFLQLECDNEYLKQAPKILFKNETFTRRFVVWDEEVKRNIERKIESVDFLQGFKFEL